MRVTRIGAAFVVATVAALLAVAIPPALADGVPEGGPSANPRYVWEQKTLSFSTDPVAMDRLGWEVIDAKRKEMGLPPVSESRWQGTCFRQPEHILFAGALGLGEADPEQIEHRRIALGS